MRATDLLAELNSEDIISMKEFITEEKTTRDLSTECNKIIEELMGEAKFIHPDDREAELQAFTDEINRIYDGIVEIMSNYIQINPIKANEALKGLLN